MHDLWHLVWTVLVVAALCVPLAISVWALLDAAHRPAWAWALAERDQTRWIALVLLGFFTVCGGLVISAIYLLRVRPLVRAAEQGIAF